VGGLAASNASAFAQLTSLGSAVSRLAASNASAFGALAWLGGAVSSLNASSTALSTTLAPVAAQYEQPFTYSTANSGGVNVYSLNQPRGGVFADSSGGVYVTDSGNNRVLHYSGSSTMAAIVLGQGGSFTSSVVNFGSTLTALSASGIQYPTSVASDTSGGVYVVDELNHRMLYFAAGATVASSVWGQGSLFTTGICNKLGAGANTLCYPYGVALDSGGKPYIADFGHAQYSHARRCSSAVSTPSLCSLLADVLAVLFLVFSFSLSLSLPLYLVS